MLLDDLLDNREPEARPALARRHIGLGDRVARLWQPDAVVCDADNQLAADTDIERGIDVANRHDV